MHEHSEIDQKLVAKCNLNRSTCVSLADFSLSFKIFGFANLSNKSLDEGGYYRNASRTKLDIYVFINTCDFLEI